MLKYTEGYLKLDGIRIHYYRTGGNKPPFILLHGATDNGLCWTPVAELLSERYDVIMPDAQGHGLSDRLTALNKPAAEVVGLVRDLGLKKPLIMGHSMGAGTAVGIAVDYPSLPKAIILEDPAWIAPDAPAPSAEAMKEMETFRNRLIELSRKSEAEIIADGRVNNPHWSETELIVWAKAKKQFDPSLFSKPIPNQRSYTDFVSKIKCPTLLITAENGIVSKAVAENAAKLWKSKQPFKWVRIEGASHNIRRDRFEEFKKALFDFLSSIKA